MEVTQQQVQDEFEHFDSNAFLWKAKGLMADKRLLQRTARHAIFEIEPFAFELGNQYVGDISNLLIDDITDYNPTEDKLYFHWLDPNSRKIIFRRYQLSSDTSYDTIFEYHQDYFKSTTHYCGTAGTKLISIDYLVFSQGQPDYYLEGLEYGVTQKKYHLEAGVLTGFTEYRDNADAEPFAYTFHYLPGSSVLERITYTRKSEDRIRLAYERLGPDFSMEQTLEAIEEHFVEDITRQIQEKVRISEDKVYCLLLEYGMQHAFPPAVAIGLERERDTEYLTGAPDMKYFTEEDTLDIDLYSEILETLYLRVDQQRRFMEVPEDEWIEWSGTVEQLYLRVCKRLYHMDFSRAFEKTDDFIVYNCEIDTWTAEAMHEEMMAYKKSLNLK
ncbi:hypothetical protein BFP72_02465 [Reichenbachiella sp. 5M10]|uniref:hypothetical protein n=1 Tax=Reichenbachiella sp. 5M10 TaxID=1889772 RepID=UPI000C15796A|nr:hypothetical protein [Reichenbachiella sp. 5M10]PIB34364.1 hypothetical protein BFP72_02465 [Reichenbachiella sp. 5M10]